MYNEYKRTDNHPCRKDCKDRCVGCQSKCERLLMYNLFDKEDYKPLKLYANEKIDKLNSAFNNRNVRNHVYLGGK